MSEDRKGAAAEGGETGSLAGDSARGRVLVTGANGFLGRSVVSRLLESGFRVEAVTSGAEPPGPRPAALAWHRADLLDRAATKDLLSGIEVEYLLHLAWAPNRGVYDSPANFLWVTASQHLLERFLEAGGKRAVFAGTSAEYDWSSGVCRERCTALGGGGAYGAAKRGLAEIFHGLCGLSGDSEAGGSARRTSGAWARIFFLFGPHEPETRLVPAVTKALLEGGAVRCSEGSQVRDYLYVDDAASALVELLCSNLVGPVNIGSGEGVRVRDLVLALARRCGGADAIEWGAHLGGGREAPLVVADVGRLREELKWRPPIGTSEGLDRTVAWWRERVAREA